MAVEAAVLGREACGGLGEAGCSTRGLGPGCAVRAGRIPRCPSEAVDPAHSAGGPLRLSGGGSCWCGSDQGVWKCRAGVGRPRGGAHRDATGDDMLALGRSMGRLWAGPSDRQGSRRAGWGLTWHASRGNAGGAVRVVLPWEGGVRCGRAGR